MEEDNKLEQIPENVLELARQLMDLGITDAAGYKNLLAIQAYSEETRKLFRNITSENTLYRNQITELGKALEVIRGQITQLQMKMYGTGPTAQ